MLGATLADSLVVDSLRVAMASVTRLELMTGRRSKSGEAANALGSLGFFAGLLFGVVSCDDSGSSGGIGLEIPPLACGLALGLGFALGGAIVGAVVGSLVMTDNWLDVPLDGLRVSVLPQHADRVGIGLSVRF